ncbi:hypothetical protein [Candidatus Electronema sp. TJ]|uniref:hypothetical protein n=1 Tax=Candidatus Electronema sp. TJ TaxID=3401573 RepID=UPI003AA7E66D
MKTVQYRLERNALTMPPSYSVRHIPRDTIGYEGIAARMARNNPGMTVVQAEASLRAARQAIMEELMEGNRVTLEDWCTFTLSFTARLENVDDPLPPLEDCLHVRVFASRPAVNEVCKNVQTERLPMSEKLPQINSAEDTVLKLDDVLYAGSALRLKGTDLFFDSELYGGECVIAGTRSGSRTQNKFVSVTDTEVVVLPKIPSQPDPWNNEYTISIATRYTEHGTLRTGIYRRRLRTPLEINGLSFETGPGILSGAGDAPFARIQNGTATASAMLRIQAALDIADGHIELSLLDMKEGGKAGEPVRVTANGTFAVSGWDGAAVSSLTVVVEDFAGLAAFIRNGYEGRLVDVLDVQVG